LKGVVKLSAALEKERRGICNQRIETIKRKEKDRQEGKPCVRARGNSIKKLT